MEFNYEDWKGADVTHVTGLPAGRGVVYANCSGIDYVRVAWVDAGFTSTLHYSLLKKSNPTVVYNTDNNIEP